MAEKTKTLTSKGIFPENRCAEAPFRTRNQAIQKRQFVVIFKLTGEFNIIVLGIQIIKEFWGMRLFTENQKTVVHIPTQPTLWNTYGLHYELIFVYNVGDENVIHMKFCNVKYICKIIMIYKGVYHI